MFIVVKYVVSESESFDIANVEIQAAIGPYSQERANRWRDLLDAGDGPEQYAVVELEEPL